MKLDMSNALHYDLAAAIRGPDGELHSLKLVTTAVLRCLVGCRTDRGGGTVEQPAAAWRRIAANTDEVRSQWRNAGSHLQTHITDAFKAAIELKLKGAEKYWSLFQKMANNTLPPESYSREYSRLR